MEKKVTKLNAVSTTISVALTAACAATAMGQQIYGTPGSPSATTTIDGRNLAFSFDTRHATLCLSTSYSVLDTLKQVVKH